MSKRDYYKVLLVSQPGKGKTYSFRNMDRDRTGFINSENKPIPFQNNFKYHARPKTFAGVMKALSDYSTNPDIDTIVIDSMSAVFDVILEEMKSNFKGFEVWNNYNTRVAEFLKLVKSIEKEVFLTAHYEVLTNADGEQERRVKTKG